MPTRLLLIDDEPSGLLALSEALRLRMHETVVDTATSSRTALSLLRDYDYHVVLSDVRMAGLDGVALLNQVRERWPHVPVILMTAAVPDREAEALISGAFAFIEKPVDLDRLLPILNVAMSKSHLQQRVREANRQSHFDFEAQRLSLETDSPPIDPAKEE
jgi:two-component system, NtrC family, response regulator GlrR